MDNEGKARLGRTMGHLIYERLAVNREARRRTPIQQISDEELDAYAAAKKEQETTMKPTLGRIVHFCSDMHTKDGTIRAAIISRVEKRPPPPGGEKYDSEENSYDVDLHVLTPWGQDIVKSARFNAEIAGVSAVGLWFWPPRD